MCTITGSIKDDEIIQSVSIGKKLQQAFLTIPATQKKDDKDIKERKKVELKGVVELRHNFAAAVKSSCPIY